MRNKKWVRLLAYVMGTSQACEGRPSAGRSLVARAFLGCASQSLRRGVVGIVMVRGIHRDCGHRRLARTIPQRLLPSPECLISALLSAYLRSLRGSAGQVETHIGAFLPGPQPPPPASSDVAKGCDMRSPASLFGVNSRAPRNGHPVCGTPQRVAVLLLFPQSSGFS